MRWMKVICYDIVLPQRRMDAESFHYFWVLSTIAAIHLAFVLPGVLVPIFTSVQIVFLLLFTCGSTIGVSYVDDMLFFRNSLDDRCQRFAMGYILVSLGGGILAAGLLGLSKHAKYPGCQRYFFFRSVAVIAILARISIAASSPPIATSLREKKTLWHPSYMQNVKINEFCFP